MDGWLKQSTAITLRIGPFLDSTDGNTQEIALTIAQADVVLSKAGGVFAAKNDATSCTHDAKGYYSCPLNATDTGTLGLLKLAVHVTGALAVWHTFMVITAQVWDSLFGADKLDVAIVEQANIDFGALQKTSLNAATPASVQNLTLTAGNIHAHVKVKDNIDFGALEKTSLNAATPASVQNIPATGTGLTAIPWNIAWDAEVQSEAQDAITASALATAANLAIVAGYTDDIGVAGAGLTALGDTRIANLDATISSRLAPAGTLAVCTLVNGLASGVISRATLAADTGLQSIRSNTAQAGAAGSITLDANASAVTDFYVGVWILLTGGTGVGQARVCIAYNATTKVATVAPNWSTTPDVTSTFAILTSGQITGVQGNVTGSVASVTGAVGSVAPGGITAVTIADAAIDIATFAADCKTGTYLNTQVKGQDNIDFGATQKASITAAVPTVSAIQSGLATPTNITAGTITTVTNLTNAPTVGDFNATMKTSLNAATPASVVGAVGSVTGNVGGNVTGSVGSLATQAKADVNAEVLDVLNVDTFAEPGQEAPAATNTLVKKIGYLFKLLRNKITTTSTQINVFADDAITVDQKSTISDDATTFTRGEFGSGL